MGRAAPPSGPAAVTTRSVRLGRPGRPAAIGPAGRSASTGFARVTGMPENYTDPSGNTEQFRAFVHTPEGAAPDVAPSRLPLIVGAAVVVLVVAVVAWLALS
ncbi:hypothetical protein GA0070613_2879 [Micromonospora inositola]|uniref:Uncharacterized protein n=2 Tax=Micromonospora inositola TaxID=47865 RepID=A0A1C5IHM7_9ACTN|nr:hypothetical protein GA0070613_2879 [Micromonospora inositola]